MRRLLPLLLAVAGASHAQRPPLRVPPSPDTVLERLPHGYAALMPSAAAQPALPQVHALLATAARSGDARLATRAEALLARFPAATHDAGVLKARAFAAQHRHDFAGALRLLDAVVAGNPRDGDARLSRAQVQLVQGRLDRARADCAALALGINVDDGLLCIAALSLRRGDYAQAAALLDRALAQSPGNPDVLRYLLTMRGEIASRAGDADAEHWFRQALALAPDDVRTLAAFARHLRARGRNRDVMQLLADAPDTDALQLQRTLAAHAIGAPEAPRLIAAQGRRYALAHAVGSQPELRDEAEYLLTLRGDADAALALAQRNFRSQRDVEDIDILQRAAQAAQRPQALAALQAWARSQDLELPPPRTAGQSPAAPAPAAARQ